MSRVSAHRLPWMFASHMARWGCIEVLGVAMHIYLKNSRVRPWSTRQTNTVGRLRVLVVDDNQNAAEALAAYLTFEGMMCRLAHGGVQAVGRRD